MQQAREFLPSGILVAPALAPCASIAVTVARRPGEYHFSQALSSAVMPLGRT